MRKHIQISYYSKKWIYFSLTSIVGLVKNLAIIWKWKIGCSYQERRNFHINWWNIWSITELQDASKWDTKPNVPYIFYVEGFIRNFQQFDFRTTIDYIQKWFFVNPHDVPTGWTSKNYPKTNWKFLYWRKFDNFTPKINRTSLS